MTFQEYANLIQATGIRVLISNEDTHIVLRSNASLEDAIAKTLELTGISPVTVDLLPANVIHQITHRGDVEWEGPIRIDHRYRAVYPDSLTEHFHLREIYPELASLHDLHP